MYNNNGLATAPTLKEHSLQLGGTVINTQCERQGGV